MPELIESYGRVNIIKIEDKPLLFYQVNIPTFSETEKDILKDSNQFMSMELIRDAKKLVTYEERDKFLRDYLKKKITEKLKDKNEPLDNIDILLTLTLSQFFGYDVLGVLLDDDRLEEVMLNGVNIPAFVVHRKHGMCISNIGFDNDQSMENVIQRIAKNVGRVINETYPLLDARLPDGSRVNVTVPPASPRGPSITIRKFRQIPFSIIELIKIGTMDEELAAFLWVCVEGLGIRPVNLIIAGGAGSGKTTTLNAICAFIPQHERVVTVEDTLELNFKFLEDWIPLEASSSLIERASNITMDTLLRNTLRMRPDRVIVGEVRGSETLTLLVAMDIGLNGSMGTLHANTAREATTRMIRAPMSVPLSMMSLLDLIIVQNRIYSRDGSIRRVLTQISEVGHVTQEIVQLGDIYDWDAKQNKILRTNFPIMLKDKIAGDAGITKIELDAELKRREKLLRYMVDAGIMENYLVLQMIRKYKSNPKEVMSEVDDYYNKFEDQK